jgi:hypothetical protein
MLEALCRQSSTTLDIMHAEDGPPITQRTSGLMFSFGQKRFTNLITARFFTPGLPLRYADYSRRLRLALSC